METEKRCKGECKEIKPLGDFYRDSRMKDGYLHMCKTCKKKLHRERMDGHGEIISIKYKKPIQKRNKQILDVNNAPVITF